MRDAQNYCIPKVPFCVAGLLLVGFGYVFALKGPHPFSHWEIAGGCVACGAILGILPFVLDYLFIGKLIEINALGAVADKIEHLNQFSAQISAATARWAAVQEFVGDNAEKTATAARQIADKMNAEVREFSEFMKKMNDSEKASLRLEVDKLRRSETEWLQVLVRILDHVFALHSAAIRSNQPKLAEQITQFQNACRGTVRRIGLAGFVGEVDEPFDAQRHQLADKNQKPFDGAVIGETLGVGYTYQGKLLRPALVRLREPNAAPPVAAIAPEKTKPAESAQDTLAIETE